MFSTRNLIAAGAGLVFQSSAMAALVTFDENPLAADSFFDPQATASFNSGGVGFDHSWSFGCCWGNFTYSNRTDTTTAGFTNDRSAITGDGAGAGADNYAVSFGQNAYINFGGLTDVHDMQVTNTTYAYLSMRDGDGFAKQFAAGDFFDLIIKGTNASGGVTGSVTFALAQDTNIVDQWTTVDLTSLGNVHGLLFEYSSSDVGSFGVNTPTYFAADNLSITQLPLPGAFWLLASAFAGLQCFRNKATNKLGR